MGISGNPWEYQEFYDIGCLRSPGIYGNIKSQRVWEVFLPEYMVIQKIREHSEVNE